VERKGEGPRSSSCSTNAGKKWVSDIVPVTEENAVDESITTTPSIGRWG